MLVIVVGGLALSGESGLFKGFLMKQVKIIETPVVLVEKLEYVGMEKDKEVYSIHVLNKGNRCSENHETIIELEYYDKDGVKHYFTNYKSPSQAFVDANGVCPGDSKELMMLYATSDTGAKMSCGKFDKEEAEKGYFEVDVLVKPDADSSFETQVDRRLTVPYKEICS